MYHYRKTRKKYTQHNKADKQKGDSCTFCNNLANEQIISSNDTMRVVFNRVSYDIFEGRQVLDHLMIVPKRHVESLKDFTDQEKLDMMTLAGEYEAKGYNVYARGVGSITRSVKHQHTHLIRIKNNARTKLIFYLKKPHILINR
jgi:diadenosine tetraphosphate (Ap4A) HIT family hydrolase